MVQFNLITGFLGSGKTTLLSNILKELSGKKRIAVIQNEFAPTGVDGKELQQNSDGFKLIEINNGSVFCVCQLNTFTQTMQKLITDYQPEIIFLEASGLSDPISVVELLQTPELKDIVTLDRIFSLVDVPNFFRGLSSLVRFKHQLMVADAIILNKIDLLENGYNEVEAAIKELNPYARIFPTVFAQIDWESLFISADNKNEAAKQFIGQESGGRPDELKACVLRTHDTIAECSLKAFVEELKKDCPRIKGFVNLPNNKTVLIHTVYEQVAFKEVNNFAGPTEIIAFGKDLQLPFLRKMFQKYQSINCG